MPFGFHWFEILIVIGFGMLIFGPKRLPELGSSIGKTIKEFQKSMREVNAPEEPVTPPPALPASQAQQLPAASAPAITTTSASAPTETVSQVKAE